MNSVNLLLRHYFRSQVGAAGNHGKEPADRRLWRRPGAFGDRATFLR